MADVNLIVRTQNKVEERDDLKWIKKNYGERFARKCRELFSKMIDHKGALSHILAEHFQPTKHLFDDISSQEMGWENFKNFIYNYFDVESARKQKNGTEIKSAAELMDDAGYILYPECLSEEDVQSFRHWYYREDGKTPEYLGGQPERHQGEEICTFDGGRLSSCRIWFAVKKNAAQLKREDFENPTRQDEYGKSVISIQFTRGFNPTLSIKNRYNHSVNNPDNTFNSDLENIIPGLSDAFERDYGVKDTNEKLSEFELDGYVNVGNKFYKYNYEINNVCFCENNIIIDNYHVEYLPSHQILADYFIFDPQENTIKTYSGILVDDCFPETFGEIEKIDYRKSENRIIVKVKDGEDVIVHLDNQMRIIGIENNNVKTCGGGFLQRNRCLEELKMPNLIECGNHFLYNNESLETIDLESLTKCGTNFLGKNDTLQYVNLPNLTECGARFLHRNETIESISFANLVHCGDDFLQFNEKIKTAYLPKLTRCGANFLSYASVLEELDLPFLEECKSDFMSYNKKLKTAKFPSLKNVGPNFLYSNQTIETLVIPKDLDEWSKNCILNQHPRKLEDLQPIEENFTRL